MHSGGYLDQNLNRSPSRLALVIALHGAAIAALIMAPAERVISDNWKKLTIYEVKEKLPPPPEPPKALPQKQDERIATVTPKVSTGSTDDLKLTPLPPVQPPFFPKSGTDEAKPTTIPPVLTEAQPDPAYAGSFQPDYPSPLARQEIEGVVKVRVLIGADGRVKAVEQVSSTDPLFFEATQRKALKSWRFKPATRDGMAIESWKVLTVRFRLQG